MCTLTPASSLTLPGTLRAPRLARDFFDGVVCDIHQARVRDDAVLLVSELVTNAVRHGLPPITVAVECGVSEMTVQITDSDGGTGPLARDADAEAESGRGLALVDLLSDAWGVEPSQQGKSVWFRLIA